MAFRKRVLVTGGAGFIGSHLCERLLQKNYEVVCVDNFLTGRKRNLTHLLDNPYFELLTHDVTKPLSVEVDEIYNLACAASPVHYQNIPVTTIRTCVLGAINMLNLAREIGATVLQSSTSEVYGDALIHPQPESYWGNVNPIGPRACYDEGKRCAETLFFDYSRQYGVKIKVARIFNTYGPHMHPDDGRVIANLVVQALTGQPLTIHGDGSQTRSFCYVDDMVQGLVRLMEGSADFTGPINLGNPQEISILQLANLILDLSGSKSKIVFDRLPPDDPKQRRPDISRAAKRLNWAPSVELKTGLLRTIDYFTAVVQELARTNKADVIRLGKNTA